MQGPPHLSQYTRSRARTALPAAVLALGLTLTACGNGDAGEDTASSPAAASPTSEVATSATAPTASESPSGEPSETGSESGSGEGTSSGTASEQASAAGDAEPRPLEGVEVQDEEMGDTVRVTEIIRDYPSEFRKSYIEDGGEVMLNVELELGEDFATSGKRYKLHAGDEESVPGDSDAKLEEAGYKPFDVATDESGEGWLSFLMYERADEYTLEITRQEAEIFPSGETLEEKVWEFPVQ
ncbi:hypothetical protein M3D92_10475 [Micrococcus terreus]|uniref:hypothetical protein n=1 Tax=Micrococcus terreus TaxID=574650 RepID=UPI0021A5E1B7|nr:hypothetical protein [Micrococcus terreus]MCT2089709.1 hypothetical protein [Micrococcus terreus]